MSATIYVRQVKPLNGKCLSVSAPSQFITSMKRAFYDFPIELREDHIPKLEGLAAGYDYEPNPYTELIEKIELLKIVEVYAVY